MYKNISYLLILIGNTKIIALFCIVVSTSHIINNAIDELSKFPGIGKKGALRMVLSLIKREEHEVEVLATALRKIKTELRFCSNCFNISEDSLCSICKSPNRNSKLICVVKDFNDVFSIESTAQYSGEYHVLGGLISPLDGIGIEDIKFAELLNRVKTQEAEEVIIALSATMEGDTTEFYLSKKLKEVGIKVSSLSRGISVGGELEYADELTLARSIRNRTEL